MTFLPSSDVCGCLEAYLTELWHTMITPGASTTKHYGFLIDLSHSKLVSLLLSLTFSGLDKHISLLVICSFSVHYNPYNFLEYGPLGENVCHNLTKCL
jgi:hypothetical protein